MRNHTYAKVSPSLRPLLYRCLYNALNDRIRNLLLSYDYSKSTDPLQPLASHLTSLLSRQHPKTYDIEVITPTETFRLHKYILSARSPYFQKKLAAAPDTTSWKLPSTIPPASFGIALKHLYLGELPRDPGGGPGTGFTDSEILAGVDRISKHLEIQNLSDLILDSSDRRLARQRRQDEVERGRDQLEFWFRENVLRHAIETDTSKADDVKWDRNNGIFADILLRADEDEEDEEEAGEERNGDISSGTKSQYATATSASSFSTTSALGIPFSSSSNASRNPSRSTSRSTSPFRRPRRSKLYPVHKAQLIRSEFFLTMFSHDFLEAQNKPHLHIVPIDCSPQVLEIILTFLYTERTDFGLDVAVDVLFAADMLFLEKVKAKAAVVISTLSNGTATGMSNNANPTNAKNSSTSPQDSQIINASPEAETSTQPPEPNKEEDLIDIALILRAAWLTRVQRLEEFAARYIAYRLESYIDDDEFAELVQESAARIEKRQETDSIELLDDIRYYLSERFRLRFEDVGLEEMEMDETNAAIAASAEAVVAGAEPSDQPVATPPHNQHDHHDQQQEPHQGSATVPQPATITTTITSTTTGNGNGDGNSNSCNQNPPQPLLSSGAVRTLDGELAGDEFAADAINYEILLGKIDALLERLKLDA